VRCDGAAKEGATVGAAAAGGEVRRKGPGGRALADGGWKGRATAVVTGELPETEGVLLRVKARAKGRRRRGVEPAARLGSGRCRRSVSHLGHSSETFLVFL
jgi:hypothetical protein